MSEKYASIRDKASVKSWEFHGIRMGYASTTFDDFSAHTASNDNEYVRLHFGLQGDYQFTYRQLNQSFDLAGGHHNLMYSKGIDLTIHNKTLEIATFGVDFPKDAFTAFVADGDPLLDPFVASILQGKSAILSPVWGTIDAKIQQVIDEILLNPYAGQLEEVFLLAKSLELLVLCVDNYKRLQQTAYQHIKTSADKAKIITARDFINARMTTPPSLMEIAKEVGINEFKLKNGFKEIFRSTIFEYLTSRRLNHARRILLDTEKTVAQIAGELGYSSPQHFHKQFVNRFGKTPDSMRKNP